MGGGQAGGGGGNSVGMDAGEVRVTVRYVMHYQIRLCILVMFHF